MVQKVTRRSEIQPGLCHPTTGNLDVNSKWNKAVQGEGWGLPFIRCAQDTVGL